MKDRWLGLCEKQNWDSDTALFCWDKLSGLYQSEDRYYHNLTHIEDCLDQLASSDFGASIEMQIAIWFHDAIYDGKRSDNEAASARWAANWLTQLGEKKGFVDRIVRLIEVTDHKTKTANMEEDCLIDIDLSILGRERKVYFDYANQIRQEYGFVPEAEYRRGRSDLLKRFLERDRVYRSEEFFNRYEKRARSNLAAEICFLEDS